MRWEQRSLCSAAEPRYKVPVPKLPPHLADITTVKVYVIQCGQFVKIGQARNVEDRFRSLVAANRMDLTLLAAFHGGQPLERRLHRLFASYRHRDEWFRLTGQVAEWIKAGCPEPDLDPL